MVNPEIFGGLVSALSRGESLQVAMMSLFNAGYSKKEIEEAAVLVNSRTPTEIMQKAVRKEKELAAKKAAPAKKTKKVPPKKPEVKAPKEKEPEKKEPPKEKEKVVELEPIKGPPIKQVVSRYGKESPKEFKKIVNDAIKSLNDLKSTVKVVKSESGFKPPIIIQHVSNYPSKKIKELKKSGKVPSKKVKLPIIILIILLIILFGSLVALFVFKEKLIEFLNNFSL